jgi:hypothetical protein
MFIHTWDGSFARAIFISDDFGESWKKSSAGFDPNALAETFTVASGIIFTAGKYGNGTGYIYKSTDDGQTWNLAKSSDAITRRILSIKVEGQSDYVFASSRSEGVLRSTDLGLSWHQVNTGLPRLDVTEIAANDDLIMATIHNVGLYLSSNLGETWSFVGQGLTDSAGYNIAFNDEYAFYGGLTTGLWRRSLAELYPLNVANSEVQEAKFSVHPNPTNGNITIDYESKLSGAVTLSVFSVGGVLVHEEVLAADRAARAVQLDASGWAGGAYTIVLKSGEEEARGAVIKK